MNFKKLSVLLLALVLMLFTACGSGAGTDDKKAAAPAPEVKKEEPKKEEAPKAPAAKQEILFWHSMGGSNKEKLEKIVNQFNESQSEYVVKAENQGKYDESTSKFFNMNNKEGRPAIIQIGEQNLQSMIDSKLIANVSDLIKESNYPVAELVPGVVSFYTVSGSLYAMPFNASSPVLYYNAEALKKANIASPKTYEDIIASAKAIKDANNGMKPFSMTAYGYAIDQMVTNLDGFIINNDNGRSGRATEVAYQDKVKVIYSFIATLVKNGDFVNYGRNFDNMVAGFNNKDIAMFITTSAQAASIIKNAQFEVGIAPLPVAKGTEAQGVYAGGGALCFAGNLSDAEKKGVMAFAKFGTSAEVQAVWAGDTGYFPINSKSFETKTMKDIYEKNPAMKVAADQFTNSKQTKKTAGPLLSQLPQLRNDLQDAIEAVFNGGDVDKAIEQAAKNTNEKIKTANDSIKK